jgi:hypothetical protein
LGDHSRANHANEHARERSVPATRCLSVTSSGQRRDFDASSATLVTGVRHIDRTAASACDRPSARDGSGLLLRAGAGRHLCACCDLSAAWR